MHLLDVQRVVNKAKSSDHDGKCSFKHLAADPVRNEIIQWAKKKAWWGPIEKGLSLRTNLDPPIEDKENREGYGKDYGRG